MSKDLSVEDEKVEETSDSFDLPTPPPSAKASVRKIHIGGGTCESCEG